MRRVPVSCFLFVSVLAAPSAGFPRSALADPHLEIAGGAPILPAMFVPFGQTAAGPNTPAAREQTNREPIVHEQAPRELTVRELTVRQLTVRWSPPLLERRIGQADRDDAIAPDLDDAILRIESVYDPTRVDLIGEAPRWVVRAGTASMNNVFADRWHLADTDPNVDYTVRYIAEAWTRTQDTACRGFTKTRLSLGGWGLGAMTSEDCARIARLRSDTEESWTRMTLAIAAPPTPIFAAPLPGARLSSQDFWAAQRARIAAIQARLRRKLRSGTKEAAR